MLSVALFLQSGIRLAITLYLVLHLLYLSLPLRHSYSVRHLGLVGSYDRNLSVSASGVFDILALYKLDYYYYYYYYYYKKSREGSYFAAVPANSKINSKGSVERIPLTPTLTFDLPKFNHLVSCGQVL